MTLSCAKALKGLLCAQDLPCMHAAAADACMQEGELQWVWQVVIGIGDPNPLVGGAGIKTLQAAGIEVELVGGAEEEKAYILNEKFMERMRAQGQ